MTWITKDSKIIKDKNDLPENCFGFVYLIENQTTGKSYIGKKQCFSTRKKFFGKKKLAQLSDKRVKKYEKITKETNWKTYDSSCTELNKDIKRGDVINKTILEFAFSKHHLTYLEIKYQCVYEVLENDNWYNSNINAKFYKSIFNF